MDQTERDLYIARQREAQQIEAAQTAATTKHLKVASLKPSVRARYDAAKASGDWSTVAQIMGEDVGRD